MRHSVLTPMFSSWVSAALSYAFSVSLGGRLQRPAHPLRDKSCEGRDVRVDAGPIECCQVCIAILNPDHGPGIPTRCQQRIHQKASYPSVAVRIRMDVAEKPVPEDGADTRLRFTLQQIEQRRHRIAHGFP